MDKTQLVLGRGSLYFEEFGNGVSDGERYIGNTTSAQLEKRVEFAESRQSTNGIALRNFRAVVREDTVLTFTTDNMDVANLSTWFASTGELSTELPSTPPSETITLKAGRFYQLGKQLNPASGARNLFALTVKVDGVYVTGLNVDMANGRFGVPSTRSDLDGAVATVSYEVSGATGETVFGTPRSIRGSLRFIANNPHGKNRNFFLPQVLLTARDQLRLKGDEWQSLTFDADVLAPITIYESGVAGKSIGEQVIEDEGMTSTGFMTYEDILHIMTNETIPSRGY